MHACTSASRICQISQSPLASQLVAPTNQLSAHEKKKDIQAVGGSSSLAPQDKKADISDITGVFGGQENLISTFSGLLLAADAPCSSRCPSEPAQADVQASLPADVQVSNEDEDGDIFGNLFSQFEHHEAGDS